MRSLFNWNTFRGYLQEEITDFEYGFLKKVFSQAALSFGAFGTLVCVLSWLFEKFSLGSKIWLIVPGSVVTLIASVACMFYYLPKYHLNPMSVGVKFVRRAYVTLIITYGTVFLVLLQVLNLAASLSDSSVNLSTTWMGLALFTTTLVVYAVPAAIGFFMQKHKTALKLSRFLRYCYFAYFGLFLLTLVLGLVSITVSGSDIMQSLWRVRNAIMLALCGIIVFVSPILSIYRMKMVIKYLDQKDPVAIRKWELFFVFEILCQLMQMAVYIFRIVFNCLSCTLSATTRR